MAILCLMFMLFALAINVRGHINCFSPSFWINNFWENFNDDQFEPSAWKEEEDLYWNKFKNNELNIEEKACICNHWKFAMRMVCVFAQPFWQFTFDTCEDEVDSVCEPSGSVTATTIPTEPTTLTTTTQSTTTTTTPTTTTTQSTTTTTTPTTTTAAPTTSSTATCDRNSSQCFDPDKISGNGLNGDACKCHSDCTGSVYERCCLSDNKMYYKCNTLDFSKM